MSSHCVWGKVWARQTNWFLLLLISSPEVNPLRVSGAEENQRQQGKAWFWVALSRWWDFSQGERDWNLWQEKPFRSSKMHDHDICLDEEDGRQMPGFHYDRNQHGHMSCWVNVPPSLSCLWMDPSANVSDQVNVSWAISEIHFQGNLIYQVC